MSAKPASLVVIITAIASLLSEPGRAIAQQPTEAAADGQDEPSTACQPPCREGYLCVEGQCVSACNPPCPAQTVCRDNRCVSLSQAQTRAAEGAWSGVHFFAGLSGAPGFSAFWPEHQLKMQFRAAGQFAFRVGVLMKRFEVGLELAPAAWYPGDYADGNVSAGPKVALNLTLGHLAEITDSVYWPLRFGAGVMASNTRTPFGMLRIDVIGFGYAIPVGPGRLLVDLALPSLRFFSEVKHLGIWSWLFNLSVVYLL